MSPIATAITATAASPPPKPDTASPPDDVSSPTKPQGPLGPAAVAAPRPPAALQYVEERPDRELSQDGMAKLAATVDLVVVAPPDLRARDVSVGNQVGEDRLRRPFGDPDLAGDVPCAGARVL